MGYQFLNYLDGHARSGKTTLLMEMVVSAEACGGSAIVILPRSEDVQWFKGNRDTSNCVAALSAHDVRRTKLRGRSPDLICIDDAHRCDGDIVADVIAIVSERGISPKIVVVK